MLRRTTQYHWFSDNGLLVLEDSDLNRDELQLAYCKPSTPVSELVYLTHLFPRGNVQTCYWVHYIDDQKSKNPLEIFQEVVRLTNERSSERPSPSAGT